MLTLPKIAGQAACSLSALAPEASLKEGERKIRQKKSQKCRTKDMTWRNTRTTKQGGGGDGWRLTKPTRACGSICVSYTTPKGSFTGWSLKTTCTHSFCKSYKKSVRFALSFKAKIEGPECDCEAFQAVIVEDKARRTKNYTICDTAHNVVENSFSKASFHSIPRSAME